MSIKRCMIRIESTGPIGEWFASLPDRLPGNQMDGVNTLLPIPPTDSVLAELDSADIITLPDAADTMALIHLVGGTLADDDFNSVLIGTRTQWRQLYFTAHWRLWCAPYLYDSDSDEQYQTDLAEVGLANTTTRADAREAIKTIVTAS
ncbi:MULTISPECIES: hypothetical protein [unclassified Oceanobacter]|uniref:hypothetical protein n=1 Tax=unclassified Oceanobacter TaxID=2620260 RepID=UPI0027327BE5|nr:MULTISPECIES: hypothetical protein [unclassified Oceanobacter]MDP2610025.1 hypothetical protein [Oceanobacter sp. 1_MG-2023]MDP2613339.1 hypothetical protein [Oceanobacter sp. 2_MG-2023]